MTLSPVLLAIIALFVLIRFHKRGSGVKSQIQAKKRLISVTQTSWNIYTAGNTLQQWPNDMMKINDGSGYLLRRTRCWRGLSLLVFELKLGTTICSRRYDNYVLHYVQENVAEETWAAWLSWSSNPQNSLSDSAAHAPAASFSRGIKIWQNNLPGIASCLGGQE